jgi:hypothetical protein
MLLPALGRDRAHNLVQNMSWSIAVMLNPRIDLDIHLQVHDSAST